jgi:diguanylate cyclase (GGDEF)-like protein/PAS domain S-box-containing protein
MSHGSAMELLLRIDQRVSQALAAPSSAALAAPHIVRAVCEPLSWACGTLWARDPDVADRLICLGAWGIDTPAIGEHLGFTRSRRPILNNAGIVGKAWLSAVPVWVPDMTEDDGFRRVPTAMRAGLRSALALPVTVGDQVLGVVEVCSTEVHESDQGLLAGVRLLGGQIGQFLLRAQALHQLGESEKRFRSLTTLSSDWYWEQDAKFRFIRFEGRGVTRSGTELAPAMIGSRNWEVPGVVPGSSDWDDHRARLERGESFRDFEYVYRDPKGEIVHISANGDPTHDAGGRLSGYRGTARDISVHKQAAQRIQYLATHDEVTGLPNRASLRQLVNQALELAKRFERRFAVLRLNVDRFQRMNDGLGHEAGDALLRELGVRLQKHLRASDVVARLEGDEFAVLAHELSTPHDAEPIARKLLAAVSEPLVIRDQDYRVTACIGIATYPQDAQDERSLMKHASLALRAAKKEGMNSLRFHDATSQPRAERPMVEAPRG